VDMVAGDVVGEMFDQSVVGSYSTVQPAAGVEIVVTVACGDGDLQVILYDGTLSGWSSNEIQNQGTNCNMKIPISNTQYMRLYANADYGYRGIQIK